jgi:tetratricopeptide (TPR) repeat protein
MSARPRTKVPAPTPSAPRHRALLPGLVITAAVVLAYLNSFQVPFLMDDDGAVLKNPSVRNLADLGAVLWPAANMTTAGRPLLNLSFALNYAWGGENVTGYHAVNLLVHLLASLALFGVVRRTLELPRMAPTLREAAPSLALVTALWWALHPLQTASVTYISQRAEMLMGLCYLFTLYAFIRRATAGSRGWGWTAVAACAAGMACKEPMATAPLVALLHDRIFVAESWGEIWRRRRALYLGLAGTWILLAVLMLSHPGGSRGIGATETVTPWLYALTESKVVVRYLGLTLWPHPLVFDYGPAILVRSFTEALPWVLALGGLLAAAGLAWRRSPAFGFLAGAFFLILAPTSTFVPVTFQPMAENRLYLPLAAVMLAVVLAVHRLAGKRTWLAGLAVAAVFLALTARRNGDYATEQRIWEDNLTKQTGNWRAHYSLALLYSKMPGREADATEQFAATVRLRPDHADAQSNLAGMLLNQPGRLSEAIAHGEAALRLNPNHVYAHANLGLALLNLPGRENDALEHLAAAVRLAPDDGEARTTLANALSGMPGRLGEALVQYEAAIRLRPEQPDLHNNYAGILFRLGRTADARRELETALRLDPNYADAKANLERLKAP